MNAEDTLREIHKINIIMPYPSVIARNYMVIT